MKQKTLRGAVACSGMGLHSGRFITMRINPAPVDTGIVFHRTDAGVDIPARAEYIASSAMATTLRRGETSIQTVEHLLAALYGLGVHNARIEIDGPEIPAMDGSAAPFVRMILQAGIAEQNRAMRLLVIQEPIEIAVNGSSAYLKPNPQQVFSFCISYPHPLLSRQSLTVVLSPPHFKREIGPARTYGFLDQYDELKSRGLARGGSLENAIVLDRSGVLNEEGLRFNDEFVRHKILDCMGDLALLGYPVIGLFHGHRSGHRLNHMLIEKLLECPSHWTLHDTEAVPFTHSRRPLLQLQTLPVSA